jgi:tetratricopeptide (TPR) repeat protein
MRLTHSIVLFALLWLCAAQNGVAQRRSRGADSSGRARAVELFQQSERAYSEGHFDDAARLLRAAHAAYADPTLTYNLARALESAGDTEGAVAAYRDYLREDPDADDGPTVRARIENLQRRLNADAQERARLEEERRRAEEDARLAREQQRVVVVTETAERQPEITPWVVAGVGAAGLVAGGVLAGLASARRDDAAQPARSGREAYDGFQEASSLALGANIAFGVGGALLLGGAIWGIVDLVGVSDANRARASEGEEDSGSADSAEDSGDEAEDGGETEEDEVPAPVTRLELRWGPARAELAGTF